MSLRVERLTPEDLPEAHGLSTTVGWNQTREDWQRLLTLFPESCFIGYVDGNLVATSTLATYGDRLGWVGMILVDPDHRRQGYGSAMFERALDCGQAADLEVIGLDATDAGRAVYDAYGFERVGAIDRLRGRIRAPDSSVSAVPVSSVDAVVEFDIDRSATDRGRLFEHLFNSRTVAALRVPANGELRGFAAVRPGRTCPQVGPIVVSDHDALRGLLAALGDRLDGEVVVDALDRDQFRDRLERAGLSVSRSLHRMTHRGAIPALDGPGVVAATGFEWG